MANSIKEKILISFYVNTIAVLIVAFMLFLYFSYRHEFTQHNQGKFLSIAQLTASMINSNDFNQLVSPSDEKSKEFRQIWESVVDAEDEQSADFSHIGDKQDVSEYGQIRESYNRPVLEQQLATDNWFGFAPIRDNDGRTVGIVGLDFGIETNFNYYEDFLLGMVAITAFSFGITALVSRRIKGFLEPVNEITEGIRQVSSGNLDYRLNLKTNDELEVIANMVNQAADIIISNQRTMEKDLLMTMEQKQNTFKVYSDVIYSMTQGKFNLTSYKDLIIIADKGVLEGETKLENAEDVGKARALVEGYLTPQGYSDDRIQTILFCVSEAATNVIKHAKDGVVQIRVLEDSVRLVVLDHGLGMDFNKLPNMIFLKGFSTKISLGVGFSIIYKFADKIYLSTSKNGTFLVMDFLKESYIWRHPQRG